MSPLTIKTVINKSNEGFGYLFDNAIIPEVSETNVKSNQSAYSSVLKLTYLIFRKHFKSSRLHKMKLIQINNLFVYNRSELTIMLGSSSNKGAMTIPYSETAKRCALESEKTYNKFS